MRNTKNAFTLVELIVVITILAILGTIAFISLQGYSADARNSKRTSDVGNIQSAISLKSVEGVPLLSFITQDTTAEVGENAQAIGGGTGVYVTASNYIAGTPNYTVLNVVEKDFLDPKSDSAYRIGATTLAGGVFQVAATMESDGDAKALVMGTYNARTSAAKTGTSDGTRFTLTDALANSFKVGDKVKDSLSNTGYTVNKVSRDGVTLTLSASTTATGLTLQNSEMDALIKGKNAAGTATGFVVNDGITYFAY